MTDHISQPHASSSTNRFHDPRAEPQRRSSTLGGPSTRRANTSHLVPKITGYRLLVIALTVGFGLSKAKLSYKGLSTAPTTLDWIYGVVAFLLLYWLGIYEKHTAHNMAWMFERDYLALLWKVAFLLWRLVVGGAESNYPNRQIPSRRSTRQD